MRWMPGACSATDCGTGFLDRIAFRQELSRREAAGEDCRAVGDRLPDGRLFATRYSPSATRYPLLATRYSLLATRYSLLATELSPTSSFLPDRCLVGPSDPTMYRYPWPFVFVSPCGAFRPEVVPVVQDKKSPSATDGDSQAFKPLLTEPERLPELPSCPWPFRAWHRPECRGPVSRSA